jgi:hypothetical protein
VGEEKPVWARQLAEPPFGEGRFTPELKRKVIERTGEKRRSRTIPSAVVALISLMIVLLLFSVGQDKEIFIGGGSTNGANGISERSGYYDHGRQLFTVSPEPDLKAGAIAGYIFHFTEPFTAFKGKKLTIEAVHLRSGIRETVSSEVIVRPSSGYPGLQRYTMRFALPLGGMWRFDVLLDGKLYGDVRLSLLEPSWDISPMFQSGIYWMRGVEKGVGFIDAGFVAGKPQKYMWHFWGNEDELTGPFVVKAVREGTDRIVDVFPLNGLSSSNVLGGANNGADRHAVTTMMLPEPGRWRLLPYIHGRLLDTIVVEVKE